MTKYFTQPLSCEWDSVLLSHAFLVVPESPTPFLGRDILSKVQASVHMNIERDERCLPLMEVDSNPEV